MNVHPLLRRCLRPRVRALPWAVAAVGFTVSAVRLRTHLSGLRTVEPGDGTRPLLDTGRFALLAAEGVTIDPAALAAAVAHAEDEGLDLLELVPADVGAEAALELARLVDTNSHRQDRMAIGCGVGQAVLIDHALLSRAGRPAPEGPLVEADLAALVNEAKCCAPTGCDLVVLPGASAAPRQAARRRAYEAAIYGKLAPFVPPTTVAGIATLAAGLAVAPGWAAAALAAYCAQPALALAGGPLAAGVTPASLPLRPARRIADAAATLHIPRVRGDTADRSAERAEMAKLLAEGTERLFEPRRTTCPWCDADDLVTLFARSDDIQGKPGRFHLDRCRGCGHTFQNPRLSPEGLDFYYRDFYDGDAEREVDALFRMADASYRGRVGLVARHVEPDPDRWLDVGTGHGHFPLMARAAFPETHFDGLDLNDGVVSAARRGWIDDHHRGLFPDLAAGLAARFDLVSMHHYLEHTREPGDELAAARVVLRPGGHLLIELPDPECLTGRLLGGWWLPWFQPQHLNLVPIANLCQRLEEEGFTVVATERGEAHIPCALSMGSLLLLNHLGPASGAPWQPEITFARSARRVVVYVLGAPLLIAALVGDKTVGRLVGRLPGGSSAYRVLARRD